MHINISLTKLAIVTLSNKHILYKYILYNTQTDGICVLQQIKIIELSSFHDSKN